MESKIIAVVLFAICPLACFAPNQQSTETSGTTTASSTTENTSGLPGSTSIEPGTTGSSLTSSGFVTSSTTSIDHDTESTDESTTTPHTPECEDKIVDAGEVCFEVDVLMDEDGSANAAQLVDANADGTLDIIYQGASGIRVRTWQPKRGFGPPTEGPGGSLNNIAVGFVNVGTDPDILLTRSSHPGAADLYHGDVETSFGALASTVGPGPSPSGVAVLHDLDGDGDDDAVIGGRAASEGSLLYAAAEGGLLVQTGSVVTGPIWDLKVGDITGEGDPDLLYVTGSPSAGLFARFGDGEGNFEVEQEFSTVAQELRGVALGDLDLDGDIDVVFTSSSNNTVGVRLNSGEGLTFDEGDTLITNPTPYAIAVADLSSDGVPDVIVAHEFDTTLQIFVGDGTGSFEAPIEFQAANPGHHLSLGDLNGDGVPDVAVSSPGASTVSLLVSKP